MIKKVARHVIGWVFLVLGIAGLFLPILQGILFILLGMIILARDVPLFRKWLIRLEERYPVPYGKARSCYQTLSDKFKKKFTVPDECERSRKSDRTDDGSSKAGEPKV